MADSQQKLQLANEHLRQLKKMNKSQYEAIRYFLNEVKRVQNEDPDAVLFKKTHRLLDLDVPDDLPSVSTASSPFTYNDLLTITFATLGGAQYDFSGRSHTPPKESSRDPKTSSKRARYTGGGMQQKQTVYTGSKGGKYILVNGRRKYI